MMQTIKIWVSAFRLRTLPLSFALVIMGSAVAIQEGKFNIEIFLLILLTTLFLQILSNLSNDYGDSVSGADQAGRVGPARAVQSGAISLPQMKKAMIVFAILSLLSGLLLLYTAYLQIGFASVAILLTIGLLCIAAAITYTVGKHPYGYVGLGDISVFIFFGLVGVVGTYTLLTGGPSTSIWLPAISVGLLSCGVLNMNNIRDIESDTRAGKRTVPIIIGLKSAQRYQVILMTVAIACMISYIGIFGKPWQLLCVAAMPPFVMNAVNVLKPDASTTFYDSQLKVISISTFAMSTLFLIGSTI